MLLALWVYATVEGIGSARHLDRLCREHDVYRWLCGGVAVNYHTLSDFRVAHQAAVNQLLTEIVAVLMSRKLVALKKVAQDGVRVRASAGAGSLHRRSWLEECLVEAEAQVKRLVEERGHPDPGVSRREQAAKERQRRTLAKAKRGKVSEARVSATDPEARVMKMPDGGYRPAYNVQLATDVGSGVIVGAAVIKEGNDSEQAPPMEDQVVQRTGRHPEAYLVGGSYAQRETIATLTERQVTLYAPVCPPRTTSSGRERSTPRGDDSPAVVAWRQRMETEDAQQTYRLRAGTAEWANAQVRSHGLLPFNVRGLGKVLSVVLLVVIAHNLLRWLALAA